MLHSEDTEIIVKLGLRNSFSDQGTLVVSLNRLKDLRKLRAAVMALAMYVVQSKKRANLLILDPEIREDRLQLECHSMEAALAPLAVEQLNVCRVEDGRATHLMGMVHPSESDLAARLGRNIEKTVGDRLQRKSPAFFEILRILLNEWMLDDRPLSIGHIRNLSGFSYPTVQRVLKDLGGYTERTSNRSVRLKAFPRKAWQRLVADAPRLRQTQNFTDASGQPRSVESMLKRLSHMELPWLVGGIIGAKYWDKELDIIGVPRLDITIQFESHNFRQPLAAIIDPGLVPAEPEDPVHLSVHKVSMSNSYGGLNEAGLQCADPVECLLDLHEMNLESQAAEFLHSLIAKKLR